MPEKIRKLKSKLRKAGFVERPAKGSHTVFYDPSDRMNKVTFAGQDGDDADKYQIKDVRDALKRAKEKRQWNP
ncbi:MAG TPA: type II toxin-antitoxin system HicA family toxin [Ktedonobacteraceae bacterium]|nr:type II toxin-antitoxin system HicA family toxin [Ktedonobacteraceae bacterium]